MDGLMLRNIMNDEHSAFNLGKERKTFCKPAAHLRKELSKLPREVKQGNQLSCFLKCAVEF